MQEHQTTQHQDEFSFRVIVTEWTNNLVGYLSLSLLKYIHQNEMSSL